ncbi:hypothetical protein ACWGH2_42400 [Streptomyces sp. NPDC054871]
MTTSFRLDEREQAKDFASYLAQLERRIADLERANPLTNAAIDGGALDVYDEEGSLQVIVGEQGDGTTGVIHVNGPPPPAPTVPVLASVLGCVAATWDGLWEDAVAPPLDFSRVEIHASTDPAFEPMQATQVGTIESPRGGTFTIPTDDPVHVRLVARTLSGTAGEPSPVAGPMGPAVVVAQDVLDNIINENKLTAGAVTAAKIALGAVNSTALADGAVLAEKLAKNSVTQAALAKGSVTLNALGGPLGDSATQRYVDIFRDPTTWERLAGTGTWAINPDAVGTPSGGGLLTAAGDAQLVGKALAVQDTDTLYRVMIRVRATGQDAIGPATLYVGVLGIADDGVTLVNRTGAASNSMHYYCATAGGTLAVADGWRTYVGYIQGRAATGATAPAGPQTDPRQPGTTHANVRFLRPMAWLNFGKGAASTMEVDAFTIEALRTGVVNSTNFVTGSVTAAAIATDAVIAGKVAADAITGREIAANSVTAAEISAGAIRAEHLTIVGGSNILPDPSFEGAVTAALILNLSYATQDKTRGNGSPASLKVDCRSATPAYRYVPLTLIPCLPGDQLYLAADFYLSADFAGTSVNIHARWEDAAGTALGYGFAGTAGTPPTEGWTRLSGTVTAPAGAVRAAVLVGAAECTAGDVWFDNAALRPVVPGVQIADGAITAPKIMAGAITTEHLVALGVTAEKIASLAITTDKLSALSVTADKLAVNSVTATHILAGSIEANHIKAGAITAEKLDADAINGKTITGATVRTAANGARIVMDASRLTAYGQGAQRIVLEPNSTAPFLYFTSDDGTNYAYTQVSGVGSEATLYTYSGRFAVGGQFYRWRTHQGQDKWVVERVLEGTAVATGGRIHLSPAQATIAGPTIRAEGVFKADNIMTGVVKVTPTPNTPTPVTLSGGAIKGTKFRAQLTANTSFPGSRVLGVGFTGLSSEGMTIWVTRTDNDETTIHWQIIGED